MEKEKTEFSDLIVCNSVTYNGKRINVFFYLLTFNAINFRKILPKINV